MLPAIQHAAFASPAILKRNPQKDFKGHIAAPRFSSLTVQIAQNNVLSRLLIEFLGFDPWIVALARNKYERIERVWDVGCRLTIATCIPLLLERLFTPWYTKQMQKRFPIPEGVSPLKMNFEYFDKSTFAPQRFIAELERNTFSKAGKVTFSPAVRQKLTQAAPLIAKQALRGKIAILLLDLGFMASKGQIGMWGKNWITEKVSGKKGFSGEFKYTSEDYRKKKSATHERTKKQKQLLSMAIGYGSVALFPLLLWGALRKPTKTGVLGALKKAVPWFNYHNAIFMSKWLIVWHTVFNWLTPGLLSARDSHERREHLVKTGSILFFGFMGDDFISGALAKYYQYRHQHALQGLSLTKKGIFGLPRAKPYVELFKRGAVGPAQALANRLAGRIFWGGIIMTALGLGISTTLLNNIYTKRKVFKEQAAMQAKAKRQELSQHKAPFVPPKRKLQPTWPITPSPWQWQQPVFPVRQPVWSPSYQPYWLPSPPQQAPYDYVS